MPRHIRNAAMGLLLAASAVSNANAGQSCFAHEVVVAELESALQVSTQVRDKLNQERARFALIARVGNDISSHGLKYTHVGFVKKRAKDDAWIVVHQLNPCASAASGLFVQGLGTFMLDDLLTHEVLVVTLKDGLAHHLERVFRENGPLKLYGPQYSMISFPGTPAKYQNSNEWVLEIIATAQAKRAQTELESRNDTHLYYLGQGFKGSIIRISPLRRTLASAVSKNIRFDDHPATSRRTGRYEVVSVESVVDYLHRTGDVSEVVTIAGPYRRSDRPSTNSANEDSESD